MSYTTFEHSDLSVSDTVSANGSVSVRLNVKNAGLVDDTDIVLVYVKQPVTDKVTPPQRLVAFTRVTVKAGESQTVPSGSKPRHWAKPLVTSTLPGARRCSRANPTCAPRVSHPQGLSAPAAVTSSITARMTVSAVPPAHFRLLSAGARPPFSLVHGLDPRNRNRPALFDEVIGQGLRRRHQLPPRIPIAQ